MDSLKPQASSHSWRSKANLVDPSKGAFSEDAKRNRGTLLIGGRFKMSIYIGTRQKASGEIPARQPPHVLRKYTERYGYDGQ